MSDTKAKSPGNPGTEEGTRSEIVVGDRAGEQELYALRHTMATISIANGADIVSISEKLGHSETSVTLDVYSHVNKQLRKEPIRYSLKLFMPPSTAQKGKHKAS